MSSLRRRPAWRAGGSVSAAYTGGSASAAYTGGSVSAARAAGSRAGPAIGVLGPCRGPAIGVLGSCRGPAVTAHRPDHQRANHQRRDRDREPRSDPPLDRLVGGPGQVAEQAVADPPDEPADRVGHGE